MASATSKKTELKLTGVARASLEELLLDYEDFLRQRSLRQWDKNSPEALAVRAKYKSGGSGRSDLSDRSDRSDVSDRADVSDRSGRSGGSDPYNFKTASAEVAANTMICLINQATYLLGRQMERLEQNFLEQGGFTERLYRERKKMRSDLSDVSDRWDRSDRSDLSDRSEGK